MRYWITPFHLSVTVCSTLNEAGLDPWLDSEFPHPPANSLLLYDSPDQLLAMVGTGLEHDGLTALSLLMAYRRLLAWSEQPGQHLLSITQLQQLGSEGLRNWFAAGNASPLSPGPTLPIPPLLAVATLSLVDSEPALLDCYYDLELRAALFGRDPDLRYRERLQQAGQDVDGLLHAFFTSQMALAALPELEYRLASRDFELQKSIQLADSLSHLHQQFQEEREQFRIVDGEKQRQLEDRDRELDDLRRSKDYQETAHEMELKALNVRLQAQLTDLDHHLAGKDKELLEAREESELTLFQLHQVQEELEHYFLSDGEKQRQLELRALDLAELRFAKATQESAHEIAKGAQERLHDQELKALRERFDLRLAELEQRLATSGSQLQEAREAAELTVLQLHKLQEELEHHFLNARSRDQLAQAQFEQLQRAQRLMVRLHPDVLSTAPYSPSLAVQVLPDEAVAITNPSLQTEALLSTYAASLQRASALLERARRP